MKKIKTKSVAKRANREKYYSPYLLGILLFTVIILEGALMSSATPADWQAGFSVLDVSSSVSSLKSDVSYIAEPAIFAASSINEFYNQAAIAAIPLFDFSDTTGTMAFVDGVNDFYQIAATEMANVLDISNYSTFSYQPKVAGASISR